MKDLSVDIIKDNDYFIKAPFDGEIIRVYVNENDKVEKNQIVALFKGKNTYVEIESDYPGTLCEICADIDAPIKKWDNIAVVDVTDESICDYKSTITSPNSPEYNILYTFQQEILPTLIYYETEMFLKGIRQEKEGFIHFLLEEVFSNNHMTLPFAVKDFKIHEEVFSNRIIIIRIDWPKVNLPLLTRRSYILINSDTTKICYYTCEKSLDEKYMISSIFPHRGHLTRYNYGAAPETLEAEKTKIIKVFLD